MTNDGLENTPLPARRAREREPIRASREATASVYGAGVVVCGTVVDYSVSGAQLALDGELPKSLRAGSAVTLGLKPAKHSYFRIKGEIRWVHRGRVGIHFEPDPALLLILTLLTRRQPTE